MKNMKTNSTGRKRRTRWFRQEHKLWLTALLGVCCGTTSGEPRNRFADKGCLHRKKAGWKRTRVCNSEDPPEFAQLGYCRKDDPFDYMELRIQPQNWESSVSLTWVLQILLSEVLNIPTSVETSTPDGQLNFYDAEARTIYGRHNDWQCMQRGVELGDCRLQLRGTTEEDYQSCCHYCPEVWVAGGDTFAEYERQGSVERAIDLGAVGEENLFVPKFTAEREPSVVGYLGLAGEEQRRTLAETFLRPTTWQDYCDQVSPSQCLNDTIAVRPPLPDETDGQRFFVPELYQGHFRATAENDCDANPQACTGHLADYPCGWSSYLTPQIHYFNMALDNGASRAEQTPGYSYGQLVDLLLASNATKSNLLIYWWSPETIYQKFVGTDMELTKLTMPPVTQECLDNRIPVADRCSPDYEKRIGSELSVCGEAPRSISKVIGGGLAKQTFHESIPDGLVSPVYDVLQLFQFAGSEVGQVLDYQAKEDTREAACEWVVDNFENLESFIPRSYPRVIQEDRHENWVDPLHLSAVVMATLSTCGVLVAFAFTYHQRNRRVLAYAQLEFLWLLLAGLFLVSLGSLLLSLPPTNRRCTAAGWMTNLGYTLELVPLIVKMMAIYQMMIAAKKMRRVVLTRRSLFGSVFIFVFLAFLFMVVWTAVDAPQKQAEYTVTARTTDDDETVVLVTYHCSSDSDGWRYTSVGWHMALLIVATLKAFQTRSVRQELNESNTLAIMIYSHFVFVCLRLVTLFLESSLDVVDMMHVRSIVYSLDCIATLNIYFLPKFISSDPEADSAGTLESSTVKQLRMLAAIATAQYERQQNRAEQQQIGVPEPFSGRKRLSLAPEDFHVAVPFDDMQSADFAVLDEIDEEGTGEIKCPSCGDVMTTCPKCGERTLAQNSDQS